MQLHVDHHYLYNQQHRRQQISEEEEAVSELSAVSAAAADEVLSHAAAAGKEVSQNNLVYLKGKAVINGARPILVYWPLFVFLPTRKKRQIY